MHEMILTSDRELWTTGNELQEISSAVLVVSSHDLDEIADSLAFDIESMVGLDCFI